MEEISLQDKENLSFEMFNCSSDFSQNCYASMHTPPPPRSDFTNWTLPSSLRHTAVLGEQNASMPLLIRIRDVRLLAGAAAFVAVLLLLVGIFSEGVPVGSRDSVASLKELNEYNFYTGTTAAMLAKPFEMALALFVPVLSLVLSPRNSLQNDSVGWRALQFCAQGALTALLTGAFSTLNVQQLDPVLVPLIVASDLSSGSSLESTVTSSDLAFSIHSTGDTLLRTAILPVYIKTTESACQGRGGWPNIATTYAFFTNDWLIDLLPDGCETEFTLHTAIGEAGSRNGSAVEGFNATLSANLLLYAMFFSQTLLAWEGLSYLQNSSLSQFQEEVTSWRERGNATTEIEFQVAASAMLRQILNDQSLRLSLAFDINATSFNASRVTLSRDIAFDAVTIEIAFDEHAIADKGSTSAATASASSSNLSFVYSLSSITDCGETACLIRPPGNSFAATATLGDIAYTQWNVEPQIQAFAACIFEDNTEYLTDDYLHGGGCSRRSTTSLLVYSFGRRVVADEMTVEASTSTNSSRVVKVTNLQRFHTITLGRLSWRTTDLSSDFNAACEVGNTSTCMGLSFLLDNTSSTQHLVVGENHLPLDVLGEFDGLYSRWTPLAMVSTPNDMQGDLLFQRNAHSHSGYLDGQCSTSVDVFATQVEQNHWYMMWTDLEHSTLLEAART
eukprot:jgi/Phyca11/103631/e_gw1.8.177.1